MNELEILDAETLDEFLASPKAVLMLGKTDCPACTEWTEELNAALAEGLLPEEVRYGKLIINQKGLLNFKKANPWLAEVDTLPYNILYVDGEAQKRYGGGGLDRLTTRLSRLIAQ